LIKAEQYLECSVKTGEGVREVLEAATQLSFQGQKQKKKEDSKQKKDDGKREKRSEDKKSSGIRNLFKGKG
jgi:Rho family, other